MYLYRFSAPNIQIVLHPYVDLNPKRVCPKPDPYLTLEKKTAVETAALLAWCVDIGSDSSSTSAAWLELL